MHYNPTGEAATDNGTVVGMIFASDPARQIATTSMASAPGIDIPPGEANYEAVGRPFGFAEDSHILTVMPRMIARPSRTSGTHSSTQTAHRASC